MNLYKILTWIVCLLYSVIYICGALVIAFPEVQTAIPASTGNGAIALLLVTTGLFGSAYPKIGDGGDGE